MTRVLALRQEEIMDLSRISDEALRAELARREQQERGVPGADYYFYVEEDADADEPGQWLFYIVHRRWWHRHHSVLDQHIGGHIILPSGFGEAMESAFEYEGSVEDGKRLLREYGYVELDPNSTSGAMWHSAFFVDHTAVAGATVRADIVCDTPAIRALLEQNASTPRQFPSLEAYRDWIAALAPNLSVDVYGQYDGGCKLCVMERATADALPPNPDWLHD